MPPRPGNELADTAPAGLALSLLAVSSSKRPKGGFGPASLKSCPQGAGRGCYLAYFTEQP